ncbi:MAG: TraR/DksA C4-type zinc finger protein [Acidobacteria bacterium]|nr:TraR/DksA C4-type zinc finger protein [Acidobacteriota bacterium]
MRAFGIETDWPPTAEWEDQQRKRCESELLDDICAALVRIGDAATRNTLEALAQLDAGTYGYCVDCHRQIPADRLEALNFAVRCASCAFRHDAVPSEEETEPVSIPAWQ